MRGNAGVVVPRPKLKFVDGILIMIEKEAIGTVKPKLMTTSE
jgi:hypothetical protein